MEFTINEEFVKDNNLTPEQVTAITGNVTAYHTSELADAKKGWDGKANTEAQRILDGAAALVAKHTGIQKTDGEKLADYYTRSGTEYLKDKETELSTVKAEYDEKLKNFKGDDATAAELVKAKEDLDTLMQKTADYDTLKDSAGKLIPLQEAHETMKKRVAWGGVKPSFPDNVNAYEADAKWEECISDIEKEYTIEFDGDKAIGVNKENHHIIAPLKDLVAKNESITKLMEGRKQYGPGGAQVDLRQVDGVPFAVPTGADIKTITVLIRKQIAKEGINPTSPESSIRFKELNDKIKQQTV